MSACLLGFILVTKKCCGRFLNSVLLVHGQVTIIFVGSVGLFVCLFVQSFSQPSLIRFRSNYVILSRPTVLIGLS